MRGRIQKHCHSNITATTSIQTQKETLTTKRGEMPMGPSCTFKKWPTPCPVPETESIARIRMGFCRYVSVSVGSQEALAGCLCLSGSVPLCFAYRAGNRALCSKDTVWLGRPAGAPWCLQGISGRSAQSFPMTRTTKPWTIHHEEYQTGGDPKQLRAAGCKGAMPCGI